MGVVLEAPQFAALKEPTRQLPLARALRHWAEQHKANAVANSFFNRLKRERIRRRTYRTRDDDRQDAFDHIQMFHISKRKRARNGMLSPADFERRQKATTENI